VCTKETYFNTNKLDHYIPSVVIYLLCKSDDVFLEEVSSGLPLIRGIEHQINLVLGAMIPNRPSYQNNHKKINEL
jgi:hypothetical protein